MIASFNNAVFCRQQPLLGAIVKASWPDFGCCLYNRGAIGFLNGGQRLHVRLTYGNSKRRAFPNAGLWEDPDDGSDDSEDDYGEEDEMEENNLDYDWEANESDKAVVSKDEELSQRKYEEELNEKLNNF